MLSDITVYTFAFFGLIIGLFFISRITIRKTFDILHAIYPNEHFSFIIISLLFFPGTLIHELSHFIMAIALLLPVHEIHVFPQRSGRYIKLGHVLYEKRDVIRGIMVGIAPVIIGIFLFWWFYQVNFFKDSVWYIQAIKIYIIFVISTTMFSSKQDLIDIGYLIPFGILLGLVGYLFQFDFLFFLKNPSVVAVIADFMYSVTIYSTISLAIHGGIILVFTLLLRLYDRLSGTRTYH